jgi:hypothetical protein
VWVSARVDVPGGGVVDAGDLDPGRVGDDLFQFVERLLEELWALCFR